VGISWSLGGPAASVGLGLIAAGTWGGSDFAGGLGARRSPALLVAASGHAVTLLILLAVCTAGHLPLPHSIPFIEGAVGGVEGALALAAFYRALAMGAMGLTAALTGLLTALVPVLFGLWKDGLPAPLAIGGLLLGCVAIWMIAHSPGQTTPPAALLLGAVSGAGFGLQLVLLKLASADGVVWALTSARIGGVAGLVLVLIAVRMFSKDSTTSRRSATGFWKLGILAGVLDTLGNGGFTLAAHTGRLDVAAVVSSLYPGFTILLAALLLRERPTGRQTLGMAVALVSAVLLSL
jgi:drug/metabolite transporter (DMT)-like permease